MKPSIVAWTAAAFPAPPPVYPRGEVVSITAAVDAERGIDHLRLLRLTGACSWRRPINGGFMTYLFLELPQGSLPNQQFSNGSGA